MYWQIKYNTIQNCQCEVPGNRVVLYRVFCTVRTVLNVNSTWDLFRSRSQNLIRSQKRHSSIPMTIGCCGDGPLAKEIENCFPWWVIKWMSGFCFRGKEQQVTEWHCWWPYLEKRPLPSFFRAFHPTCRQRILDSLSEENFVVCWLAENNCSADCCNCAWALTNIWTEIWT